jgi:anti-sigma-K factor RskA
MTNDHLHELTAAYALDALDADDRRAFEEHLGECENCRSELAALGETVGALAYSAEGPVPSSELRGRIIDAARAEPPTVVALRPRRTRYYVGTALAAAAAVGLAIGLWAALSGSPANPRLALSLQPSGSAQLTASGFDRAPAGKVYEIWLIKDGKPYPADAFGGGDTYVVRLGELPKGAVVAVTLERAPAAQKPTTPILARTTVV